MTEKVMTIRVSLTTTSFFGQTILANSPLTSVRNCRILPMRLIFGKNYICLARRRASLCFINDAGVKSPLFEAGNEPILGFTRFFSDNNGHNKLKSPPSFEPLLYLILGDLGMGGLDHGWKLAVVLNTANPFFQFQIGVVEKTDNDILAVFDFTNIFLYPRHVLF